VSPIGLRWAVEESFDREQYRIIENSLNTFDLSDNAGLWSRRFGSGVTSQKDFKRATKSGSAVPLTGDLGLGLSFKNLVEREGAEVAQTDGGLGAHAPSPS